MQVSVQLRDERPSILGSGEATISIDRTGRVQLAVRSDVFVDQRLLVLLNSVELRDALTAALEASRPPTAA